MVFPVGMHINGGVNTAAEVIYDGMGIRVGYSTASDGWYAYLCNSTHGIDIMGLAMDSVGTGELCHWISYSNLVHVRITTTVSALGDYLRSGPDGYFVGSGTAPYEGSCAIALETANVTTGNTAIDAVFCAAVAGVSTGAVRLLGTT